MIPNRWYAVLESHHLKRRPLGVRRLGEDLVLWRRADGTAVCMPDRCPHRGAALSRGRVAGDCIACPWHGFQFDAGGHCTLAPCSGRGAHLSEALATRSLPLREERGLVWLWWGEPQRQYPPLPWFDELPHGLSHAVTRSYELPYRWERMMETNIDIHHTPFVHRWSVPGVGTLLDPYEVEVDGERIHTRGNLRRDDGRGAAESPGMPFRLDVIFPNLICIHLTPKLLLLVIATAVDDEHTWILARYYQRYTDLPLLRKFLSWVAIAFEMHVVQPQDWRIFDHMRPRDFDRHAFRLVPADKGITAYFAMRDRVLHQLDAEAGERRAAG